MAYELGNVSKLYNDEGGIALTPLPGSPVEFGTVGSSTVILLNTIGGAAPFVLATSAGVFAGVTDDVCSWGYNSGPAGKITPGEVLWGMQLEAQYKRPSDGVIFSELVLKHVNPANTVNVRPLQLEVLRDNAKEYLSWGFTATHFRVDHPKGADVESGLGGLMFGMDDQHISLGRSVEFTAAGAASIVSPGSMNITVLNDETFRVGMAASTGSVANDILQLNDAFLTLTRRKVATSEETLVNSRTVLLRGHAWNGSDSVHHDVRFRVVPASATVAQAIWYDKSDNEVVKLRLDDYRVIAALGDFQAETVGKGFVASSPDGTAYRLTPPNGGGAAAWVAVE